MSLEGRVALVTGGGRGIGAATARVMAQQGARVVVSDLDEAPAAEVAGPIGGLPIACDVSKPDSVEAMVARTVKELGRLDILVTCAGIIRDNLLFKMSDDDWDSVIDTHLKGTFLCARAAQKHMVPQKYGKMVFLSSTSALGNRGQANYSAAKAGLQGMARTLAIELGPLQHQRERGRAGIRRDPDDAGDRRAHGRGLRDVQVGRRVADSAAEDRAAGGHRERDRVPVQRRVGLRLGADDLREGRALNQRPPPGGASHRRPPHKVGR